VAHVVPSDQSEAVFDFSEDSNVSAPSLIGDTERITSEIPNQSERTVRRRRRFTARATDGISLPPHELFEIAGEEMCTTFCGEVVRIPSVAAARLASRQSVCGSRKSREPL
jgi:hypothetical protein